MLGVSQEIVNMIAEMPTEHSWLLPLMKLSPWEIGPAEGRLADWVNSQTKTNGAHIVVKNFLANLLEWKAVEMFKSQHLEMMYLIPEITTPEDAVEIANADMNGTLTEEEKKEAIELLNRLQNFELQPELQTLLPPEQDT